MLQDISSATSSIHINQFGFRPGSIGDQFAEVLSSKASDGIPVRVVVDRQGSDPDRGSRVFYERLLAAGIDVRVVRATQLRLPSSLSRSAAPLDGTSTDSGTSTIASSSSSTVASAGSAARGSRTTSTTGGSTTCSFASRTRHVAAAARLRRDLPLAGGVILLLDFLFPAHEEGPTAVPATVLHNAPGGYRPITSAIADLLDGARESLDVVNPYVTDRRMIRRIAQAARRGVRVRLRAGNCEQLGLRSRAAPPPRGSAPSRRSHPRVPDHAPCEGVRA